ncbi:MAG: C_GCAxxG_C_C family protein [Clostridia bacterium]|nr:C_GCAxxG_C_C family protein [Clostridia bacterium]MBP3649233.1 C_GCAxxG_C_C family protein [Clostridia bacterium]
MQTNNVAAKVELARDLYLNGYNCAQAVFAAFSEEMGISRETALRIASGMGGGMGGLRMTCGAVSAMAMVLGTIRGYDQADDYDGKKQLYADIQRLHGEFIAVHEISNCRELLAKSGIVAKAQPAERTPEYYRKRPCARYIELCAELLAKELGL